MADSDGDHATASLAEALQHEQQQERFEQHEEMLREGDIDSRIADTLSRAGSVGVE